jgi:hypothetical protein
MRPPLVTFPAIVAQGALSWFRVPCSGLPGSGSRFRVQVPRSQPGSGKPNPDPNPERGTRNLGGTLSLKVGLGAVGLRPGVPLSLGTQDAAPLLVLGYRHPALDADAHPLARFGISRKEPLQKGHEFSRISFYLRRKKGSEGLLNRQKTTDWVKFESGGGRIICDSSVWDRRGPGARDRRFSVWP